MLLVMQTQDLTPELREGHAKLARAVSLACSYHQQQVRKGTTIPYVSHLLQVAGLVLEYGGDLEQAAAGVLHATGADAPTQERDLAHATTRAETGPWCGGKDRPRRRCGSTDLVAWRGHFGSAAGRLDQTPATCEGPGHAAVRHAQGTITTGPAREGRAPLVRRACRGLSLPSRGTQAGPSAGAC